MVSRKNTFAKRIDAGQPTAYTKRKLYDGLGRLIETQTVGVVLQDNACSTDVDTNDDICTVVVDYNYDANGKLHQQTVPYARVNGGAAWQGQQLSNSPTVTEYDVLGWVVSVTAPDGTATLTSYLDSGASAPDGYAYQQTCTEDARHNC